MNDDDTDDIERQLPALIEKAQIPAAYQHAKEALQACERVDECQDWADKTAALAVYARQAGDCDLEDWAKRIRARATRRMGELLGEFRSKGGRPKTPDGTVKSLSMTQAASEAGLSERQRVNAVRIARIPEKQFEEVVESHDPPTTTTLAQMGRLVAPEAEPDTDDEMITSGKQVARAVQLMIGEVIDFLVRLDRWAPHPSHIIDALTEGKRTRDLAAVNRALLVLLAIKTGLDGGAGGPGKPMLRVV